MQNEPEKIEITASADQGKVNHSNIDYSKTQAVRFYANHVGGTVTMFDIRLILSDVNVDTANEKLVANTTLTLLMSPEIASLAHATLTQALENYKSKFGPLRIPEARFAVLDPATDLAQAKPAPTSEG